MTMDVTLREEAIDESKVELFIRKKRKKVLIWTSFLLFGWSYGSLGKQGLQLAWYAILLFSVYNLWSTYNTRVFDAYSSGAVMGTVVMVIWWVVRLFTLNSDIRKYNNVLADFLYLTPDERVMAGID